MSRPFHKEIGNVSALMIKPVISVQRTLSWIIYSSGLKICRGKSHTSINPKYVICIAPAAFWSCLCPTWRSGFVSFQHADIFKTRILCVVVLEREKKNDILHEIHFLFWSELFQTLCRFCTSATRWLYWIF